MPRTPKRTPDQIMTCWQSFAGNEGLSVKEGTRLRADHELVKRFSDKFVPDGTPDDEIDKLRAEAFAPVLTNGSEPLGRVRLKIRPRYGDSRNEPAALIHGHKPVFGGDEVILEGKDAEHLVDVGVAEIIAHLKSPKKTAEPVPDGG